MEVTFSTDLLEELYLAKTGRKGIDKTVIKGYQQKIQMLQNAADLEEVSHFQSLRLEKLKGVKYRACYSIRVNKQYRIIFKEGASGRLSILILELSKHYE